MNVSAADFLTQEPSGVHQGYLVAITQLLSASCAEGAVMELSSAINEA
jgi:hypothetical protein